MLYNIKKPNEPYQVYIQKTVDGIAKTTLKKRWLSTPFFLTKDKMLPFFDILLFFGTAKQDARALFLNRFFFIVHPHTGLGR